MSARTRIVVVVVALAIAIGAFIALQPADKPGSKHRAPTVTAETTTTGGSAGTSGATGSGSTGQTSSDALVPTITIRDGKPVGGVKNLHFSKGDRVRFRVQSDIAEEVHVHGYNLAKEFEAGDSISFDFAATIDGRFEIELEHSAVQIAQLTVDP
jgi:hypothetical protein